MKHHNCFHLPCGACGKSGTFVSKTQVFIIHMWKKKQYSKLILSQKKKAPDQTSLRKQVFTEEQSGDAALTRYPREDTWHPTEKATLWSTSDPKALLTNVKHLTGSSQKCLHVFCQYTSTLSTENGEGVCGSDVQGIQFLDSSLALRSD